MGPTGKKLDLIQELTTHKNDYKPWPIPKHEFPSPPRCDDTKLKKGPPPRQIDWQSHLEYQTYVPFDLYIYKKPIVGEDPREFHKTEPEKPEGGIPEHFKYTLPAKSPMDITEEDLVRNLLIATYGIPRYGMYEEACLKVSPPPKASDCTGVRPKVEFVPNLYPKLPPGWLNAAKHWDCLQSRILGNPTKTFWERKGPEVECFSKSDFNEFISPEMRCEIRALIDAGRLRLPFDVTKTGYGGYRPMIAKGVPLERHKDFDF